MKNEKIRCIISFIDNKNHLLIEMYYLFECFMECKLYENTDLIFCGPPEISNLVPVHDSVIYLPTQSISENCKDEKYKMFNGYHFINSISCIVLNKDYLLNKNYKYMLKTDSDVFITPNFKDFFPDITQIYTGGGGYSHIEGNVKDRIKKIAVRENLRYQDVTDIGATWYGSCKLLIDIAELTLKNTGIILEKDFKENEGKWPGFFRGVSSMYGSELAINDLVDKNKIIISSKFDARSDSTELWKKTGVYHIHCWHGSKMFCKFENRDKKYLNYDINKLNYNKTNEYCLLLSLRHKDKLLSLIKEDYKPFIYRRRCQYPKKNIFKWILIVFLIIILIIFILNKF
jgi:hypothetical protein